MLIDFSAVLKTPKGLPLKGEKNKDVTLGDVAVQALTNGSGENDRGKDKVRRWNLACRIDNATGPIEVSEDDVAEIRTLCDKVYGTIVYAQVEILLDEAARRS